MSIPPGLISKEVRAHFAFGEFTKIRPGEPIKSAGRRMIFEGGYRGWRRYGADHEGTSSELVGKCGGSDEPAAFGACNSIKLNVPAPKIVAIDRVALAVLERTKLPVTASS